MGTFFHSWWEYKLIQVLWRIERIFLKKIGLELPYDTAILLLVLYPEKTIILKYTCTPIFIAELFTIARTWKQLRCPSTNEQIKEVLVPTYNGILAIKRNKFESVVVRWMNLEPVIQNEVGQKEKNKHHILTHIYGIQKNGTDELICRAVVETRTLRTDLRTQQGKESMGRIERMALKHIHYHV